MTVKFNLHSDIMRMGERNIVMVVRGIIRRNTLRFSPNHSDFGKVISTTINRRVMEKDWDKSTCRVKKKVTGAPELNRYLDFLETEILKHYDTLCVERRLSYKAMQEFVYDLVKPYPITIEPEKTFPELFVDYLRIKKHDLAPATRAKFTTLARHVETFGGKNTHKLLVSRLNIGFFDDFRAFLLSEKGYNNNSVGKALKMLKTVLHFGAERGCNINPDYKKVKVKSESTDSVYLTESELFALYRYDFKSETLDRVRDVFCLQCFTGQRYSDVAAFKFTDVKDGFWMLRTKKTKDTLQIPLNQYAMEILNKYRKSGRLPVISAQKSNTYLKDCCKLAGINDNVTITHFRGNERIDQTAEKWNFIASHSARRTFVTLSLERGMRPETVMKITGHKDHRMLKKYTILTDGVAQKEMQQVWGDLRVIQGRKGKAV